MVWLLLLILAILLAGALQAAWQGRDQPTAIYRVPIREGLPGRLVYIAQLLQECQFQARHRLQLLHYLDGRLRKRASSLSCPAKR